MGTVMLVLSSVAVAGCQTTGERIGANDGNDACRAYVVALDSTGDFFEADMLKGAAGGAMVGALAGLQSGHSLKAALIGAAVGTAVGTGVGYWSHLQQESRDQAVLQKRVYADLASDNAQITKAQQAWDQLYQCRKAEISKVNDDLKVGRITREVATQKLAVLHQQFTRDRELARKVDQDIVSRGKEYQQANQSINPGSDQMVQKAAARQEANPNLVFNQPRSGKEAVFQQTTTNVVLQNKLNQSIDAASAHVDQGASLPN